MFSDLPGVVESVDAFEINRIFPGVLEQRVTAGQFIGGSGGTVIASKRRQEAVLVREQNGRDDRHCGVAAKSAFFPFEVPLTGRELTA